MTVTQWFQFIQESPDDTTIARRLLGMLHDYRPPGNPFHTANLIEVNALIAAIRLDQMAKEIRE